MTVPSNIQTFVTVTESKVAASKSTMLDAVMSWCCLNFRAILAELISTTFLLTFGCMSCIPLDTFAMQSVLYPALGFGFVVMFNIQSFGHLSGAHMNPCITVVALLWGKMSITLALAYMTAQVIGATFGSWIVQIVSPIDMVSKAICATQPAAGVGIFQALVIEAVLTAGLCIITCAVWDPVNENKQDSTALKFGLTIAGLSLAGGPLTGASMNPARTLGPAIITGTWNAHWVYWAGPMIGSVLASALYIFTFLNKKRAATFEEEIRSN